jgi:hypothetical protein
MDCTTFAYDLDGDVLDSERVKQLCVRTCVARNIKLSDYTDMTLQQLQMRAKANDDRAKQLPLAGTVAL